MDNSENLVKRELPSIEINFINYPGEQLVVDWRKKVISISIIHSPNSEIIVKAAAMVQKKGGLFYNMEIKTAHQMDLVVAL